MRIFKSGYKHGYNSRIHKTASFKIGNYVIVDKPPLATTSKISADALAKSSYNKLQRRSSGSYFIMEMRASAVTIDEHDIPNTILIDRISHAPTVQDAHQVATPHNAIKSPTVQQTLQVQTSKTILDKLTKRKITDNLTKREITDNTDKPRKRTQKTIDKFVINYIIRHIRKVCNVKSVVRLYGYGPAGDTVETADQIPQHFISCYRRNYNKN